MYPYIWILWDLDTWFVDAPKISVCLLPLTSSWMISALIPLKIGSVCAPVIYLYQWRAVSPLLPAVISLLEQRILSSINSSKWIVFIFPDVISLMDVPNMMESATSVHYIIFTLFYYIFTTFYIIFIIITAMQSSWGSLPYSDLCWKKNEETKILDALKFLLMQLACIKYFSKCKDIFFC